MLWIVALLLCLSCSFASAQESDDERPQQPPTKYDQMIIRFNTSIQPFASWEAFKAAVFPRVPPGKSGNCYASTEPGNAPEKVALEAFPQGNETAWQETAEHGWRQQQRDRTFVEYRVNSAAGVLLLSEGFKPRFFFAYTRKLCEFPLAPAN